MEGDQREGGRVLTTKTKTVGDLRSIFVGRMSAFFRFVLGDPGVASFDR